MEDVVNANVFSWRTRSVPEFEQERAAAPGNKMRNRFPKIGEQAGTTSEAAR